MLDRPNSSTDTTAPVKGKRPPPSLNIWGSRSPSASFAPNPILVLDWAASSRLDAHISLAPRYRYNKAEIHRVAAVAMQEAVAVQVVEAAVAEVELVRKVEMVQEVVQEVEVGRPRASIQTASICFLQSTIRAPWPTSSKSWP